MACMGLRRTEVDPVEASVAEIFSATWRFFPTPVRTIFPPRARAPRSMATASSKRASSESRTCRMPSISTSKTSLAMASAFMEPAF